MAKLVAISMMLFLAMAGAAPCNVEESGESGECVAEQSAVSLLQGKMTMKKDGVAVDDEDGLVDDEDGRALLTQRDNDQRLGKGVKKVVKRARRVVRRAVRVVRKALPSFNKVFGDIKRHLGSFGKIIPNCRSVNDCINKIKKMGANVLGKFFGQTVKKFGKNLMNSMLRKAGKAGNSLNRMISGGAKKTMDVIKQIGKKVSGVARELKRNLRRKNMGRMCINTGIWYMLPTDCGAFKEMENVLRGRSSFNNVLNKFRKCVGYKGMLKMPTPFFQLRFASFCVPEFIKKPLEYVVGAFVYGGSALKNLINGAQNQVKNFVKKNLGLAQIGRAVNMRRAFPEMSHDEIVKAVALEEESGEDGGGCGHEKNWGVTITIGLSVSFPVNDAVHLIGSVTVAAKHWGFGVSAEIGMFVGCINRRLKAPQPLFQFTLAYIAWSIGAVAKGSVGVGVAATLTFSNNYPSFPIAKQVAIKGAFNFAIGANVPIMGMTLGVGLGFGFPLPAIAPKGFSFKLGPLKGGSLLLDEENETTLDEDKFEELTTTSSDEDKFEDPVLHHTAKTMTALTEIGQLDQVTAADIFEGEGSMQEHFIRTALTTDSHMPELIRRVFPDEAEEARVKALVERGEEVSASAQFGDDIIDAKVGGSLAMALCLHFPCHHQR